MKYRKYGKSVGNILRIKNDFFSQNKKMLEMSSSQADALLCQPERRFCKICHESIDGEALYSSQRMTYYLCPVCGHLNSRFEDTEDFASRVYLQDDYENNYSESSRKKYEERLRAIYVPKGDFLIDVLQREGIGLEEIDLLDVGAGSGYFVCAMRALGCKAMGIEISEKQVDFANAMAEETVLQHVDSSRTASELSLTQSNTVSFIGVLEHIINLDEVISAVNSNENIRYIYLSVPMFSLSCVLEAAFQNCYNRHAGGTHTHLFSDSSLLYMSERMGFEELASWRFGSDMMDLYRMLCVSLDQNGNEKLREYMSPGFLRVIDDLQVIMDKSEFSSELHMVLKRKSS